MPETLFQAGHLVRVITGEHVGKVGCVRAVMYPTRNYAVFFSQAESVEIMAGADIVHWGDYQPKPHVNCAGEALTTF